MDDAVRRAIEQARKTMNEDLGGPFGAAIIDTDGTIVCVASNTVLGDNDPTAHAEVNAIRLACKIKGTYDLSGCTIYATGYPCPYVYIRYYLGKYNTGGLWLPARRCRGNGFAMASFTGLSRKVVKIRES